MKNIGRPLCHDTCASGVPHFSRCFSRGALPCGLCDSWTVTIAVSSGVAQFHSRIGERSERKRRALQKRLFCSGKSGGMPIVVVETEEVGPGWEVMDQRTMIEVLKGAVLVGVVARANG